MTKLVRIENADTSLTPIVVEVWQYGVNGAPDELVEANPLWAPTQMTTAYVHPGRYLKIREVEHTPPLGG